MSLPRPSVRARLALLYVALVAASTGVLLALSWWLIARHLDRTLPDALAANVRGEVAYQYLLAFLGVLLVSVAVGWLVAGRLLAPLARMTGVARRVSERRLDERIPVSGQDDELQELAETLNDMLDRLSGSFESQRRFVANASHELRSPLTVIRTEAEVALANPASDPDELREMARSVVEASRRTEALLASLLILAGSQRGLARRRRADLAAAARAALDLHDGEARSEGVRLRPALEPAVVEGDPALLERLAANLVENAVRYNRPGGRVEVTTTCAGGLAELSVANTGPPVSAEDAARLAEPFERLGRAADGRGAGLGLSIVKAVGEAHGGTLAIEPLPEGGLRVSVRLPAAAAAPGARADASPTGSRALPAAEARA